MLTVSIALRLAKETVVLIDEPHQFPLPNAAPLRRSTYASPALTRSLVDTGHPEHGAPRIVAVSW